MELNTSLTNGEVTKVRKQVGSRAVYDFEDKPLCFWTRKYLYDLNGKKFAKFERKETVTEGDEERHIRYYRYCGEAPIETLGIENTVESAESGEIAAEGAETPVENAESPVENTAESPVESKDQCVIAENNEAESGETEDEFAEESECEFSSDGKYIYRGEKRIGRIEKRNFLVLVAILIGLLLASSGIFALYAIIWRQPPPEPEYVTFTITDKEGEWGAEGEINLFNGMILKPGVKGEYWFKISNPNQVEFKYAIRLDFEYEDKTLHIPMKWTLKMNNVNVPLAQSDEGIYSASDMIFAADSVQLFMLCFDWPFEQGTDPLDTQIGINAGVCKCTITVTCEEYNAEV